MRQAAKRKVTTSNVATNLGEVILKAAEDRAKLLGKKDPKATDLLVVPEVNMTPAIDALKALIASWKKKIRLAHARAVEKAEKEAADAAAEVERNETARRSQRERLESRAHVLEELAISLKDRTGWVWQDEIDDMLEPRERVFIGQEIVEGDWTGGFWRGDLEVRGQGTDRRYVDFELIDAIAARKMFELESTVDGMSAKNGGPIVDEFVAEWTLGRKRPVQDDDE